MAGYNRRTFESLSKEIAELIVDGRESYNKDPWEIAASLETIVVDALTLANDKISEETVDSIYVYIEFYLN